MIEDNLGTITVVATVFAGFLVIVGLVCAIIGQQRR